MPTHSTLHDISSCAQEMKYFIINSYPLTHYFELQSAWIRHNYAFIKIQYFLNCVLFILKNIILTKSKK